MRSLFSAGLVLIALATACRHDDVEVAVVKNSCLSDVNCGDHGAICDQTTQQCVRLKTVEPYHVIVQVQAEIDDTLFADASTPAVEQAAFDIKRFEGTIADKVLELPSATLATGAVEGELDGSVTMLESEVTLTPRSMASLSSIVVNTAKRPASDAGVPSQFKVLLNPDLGYDVKVQPLLSASAVLPPVRQTDYDPKEPLLVRYGQLERRAGRFTGLGITNWEGCRVRLEDKATGDVLSSVSEVGSGGEFALYTQPEVFANPGKFNLVVGLTKVEDARFLPWHMKINVDGARFLPDAIIPLPRVPSLKRFNGTVEAKETPNPRLAYAELLFLSNFPSDPTYVGDEFWCQLSGVAPGQVGCSARVSTTANAEGRYDVPLIPGSYRVIVTPNRSAPNSLDRATTTQGVTTQSMAEGESAQVLSVEAATRYNGTVLSPQNIPLPNVTVTARALGIEEAEPGEVSKYNRSTSAVTNDKGQFSLWVDVGHYDLSVETPAESGFAWLLCPNLYIKPREANSRVVRLRALSAPAPVFLSGTVQHRGVTIANARVDAFAVLETAAAPRLVQVARAVTDKDGAFRLAMPPHLPAEGSTCPPKQD